MPERRPLASRDLSISRRLAARLIALNVRPDAISLSSIALAAVAGACLAGTAIVVGTAARFLFLLAAAFVQLRLLANMLDGMVAVGAGEQSALGDLFNEIPDRLADCLILIAAGYSLGGSMVAGYLATAVALFLPYLRAFGATHGVDGLFLGPMAKPHRMAAVSAGCLWAALTPASWAGGVAHPAGAVALALWLVVTGGVLTAGRRLQRIVSVIGART